MSVAPPVNLDHIDEATRQAIASGFRILETHKYADSDIEHIRFLQRFMDLPPDAIVVDAGCGIGEVSKLLSEDRPDLMFYLVNLSRYQLSLCPIGDQYAHFLGDFCDLPLIDGYCDAVIFNSALCQMDIEKALSEAARILKPGGILFINDMIRWGGDGEEMELMLAARVLRMSELLDLVIHAGFKVPATLMPGADDSHFRAMLRDGGAEHLLDHILPVLIRATRKE